MPHPHPRTRGCRPGAEADLVEFLAKLKLSNARKHLETVDCCSLAALKALKANDFKAMGFRSEVRSRLQKHIADEGASTDAYSQEEQFVTVDEEEEAAISQSAAASGTRRPLSPAPQPPLSCQRTIQYCTVDGVDMLQMLPHIFVLSTGTSVQSAG